MDSIVFLQASLRSVKNFTSKYDILNAKHQRFLTSFLMSYQRKKGKIFIFSYEIPKNEVIKLLFS